MIDWRLATNVAGAIAGMQPAPPSAAFEHVAGPSEESARLVSAYTGLQALSPLPHPEPVDRAVWIESNISSLKTVLDPVAGRLGSGMLLFVSPNLARAAGTLDAESDELLRWVALHEVTHSLQFGGVPWLREHLAGMVSELLAALDVDPRRMMRLPDASDLKALLETAREGNLTTLVVGPERRALLDRMQAFMAVLEGYAEHVMDAVGIELLPNLPKLREALDRRRRDRSGLFRVLERLLGFELKMRQYQLGKAFCDAVVTDGGIAALNRVWESPDRLPTLAEIENPAGWLARTTPAGPA